MEFAAYLDPPAGVAEDLVNTENIVRGIEKLTDLPTLVDFLAGHGIRSPSPPTESDLVAVRALRPLLRPIFGVPDESDAVRRLNAVLEACGALPQLGWRNATGWHLHVSTVPEAPLAHLVGAVAAFEVLSVIAAGGFERLHVCGGARCAEVFIDLSRNRSRRYCSPAICGNRASAAAYRSRQRARR